MSTLLDTSPASTPDNLLPQPGVGVVEKTQQHRATGEPAEDVYWDRNRSGELLVSLNVSWIDVLPSAWLTVLRLNVFLSLLHIVILAQVYNRKRSKGGFVSIPVTLARKIGGCPLGSNALNLLVDIKILESDNQYIVGHKARGFRFSKRALSYGFHIGSASPRIAKRLKRHRESRLHVSVGANPVYSDLWRTLQTVTLADGIWPLLERPASRHDLIKKVWRIFASESIRRQHWYFSHDEKTGRCFNNVTNYPKELRPFLLLEGHPTAECDIANSQPLFLANLAYGLTPSEERSRYVDLVCSGRFYETLGQCVQRGLDSGLRAD